MSMKIYLARPISGCTFDEVVAYYRELSAELWDAGYQVTHPMTAKGILRNDIKDRSFPTTGFSDPCATNHAILARDRWMVMQADVVYINLCGATRVSIGCVAEMAIAHATNKHIVLAMEADSVHNHAFILEMASVIFNDDFAAETYLIKLIKGDI
jgi:nucleoside 2-deoxyribosyltransferase